MPRMLLQGTTDSGGDATIKGTRSIRGLVMAVRWDQGDLASTTDAVLSTVNSLAANTNILTLTDASADAMYYPKTTAHSNAGAAQTAVDTYQVIDGVPQLVLAQGGNAKTGGLILYYTEL